MKKVTLTIDGNNITVPSNFTIMDAAKKVGIKIPALCYDPNLEIVSACRLCLVEIEGTNKLKTSCSTKIKEGMVVYTETEKLTKIRREILQLLLDSHPNDCLTCQKAGECLLQEYSYRYDVKFRQHDGEMRPKLYDISSPYIFIDNSKCILCGKCVRTCNQIKEERQVLAFSDRGYDTKIVADLNQTFEESKCVSCNRCVTVCPTGALVDKRFAGKARVWNSEVRTVVCKSCSYGCEYDVLSKKGKNIAVRAKSPSNGRPLCLTGRLMTELKYLENPETPYRKIDRKFVESNWISALGLNSVMDKINKLEEKNVKD